ncbi:hypothetical protein F5B18DRAFT_13142 [Nemania serpens]|nr:hypothetical protein F5B18DRAFT_13142 [Nemania serpens]
MEHPIPPRKISAEEWDLHKGTIMALYLGHDEGPQGTRGGTSGIKGLSLAKLAYIMSNDHGFSVAEHL